MSPLRSRDSWWSDSASGSDLGRDVSPAVDASGEAFATASCCCSCTTIACAWAASARRSSRTDLFPMLSSIPSSEYSSGTGSSAKFPPAVANVKYGPGTSGSAGPASILGLFCSWSSRELKERSSSPPSRIGDIGDAPASNDQPVCSDPSIPTMAPAMELRLITCVSTSYPLIGCGPVSLNCRSSFQHSDQCQDN